MRRPSGRLWDRSLGRLLHRPQSSPGPARACWAGNQAGAAAFLRVGPLRFRPGQADLLHLDLWDGPVNLLRDGGTGAYNPAPAESWWPALLGGTAGHNTVEFDAADQMPRLSRFLFARWPRTGRASDGAWVQDHHGRRHERRIAVAGRRWTVEDCIGRSNFRPPGGVKPGHFGSPWQMP